MQGIAMQLKLKFLILVQCIYIFLCFELVENCELVYLAGSLKCCIESAIVVRQESALHKNMQYLFDLASGTLKLQKLQ